MENNLLGNIPEDKKGDWSVLFNGKDVTQTTNHVRFQHPKFGIVELGLRENGAYVGPIISEFSGGGIVLILHLRIMGTRYIALVRQNRHNMSGKYSVPAGFLHKDENRTQGTTRVSTEEISDTIVSRFIHLNPGRGINANRAFFHTPKPEDGLSFHAAEFDENELKTVDGKIYRLKKGVFSPTSDPIIEKIYDCIFVPLDVALHYVQDDFIHIGAALLVAHLTKTSERDSIIAQYENFFME